MTEILWSDFYNGMIEVKMVGNLKEIPQKAKYKYTDTETNIDIYCDDTNDNFYGLTS
jgi:hypothetical protein